MNPILSAEQIRLADEYTITTEPVSSIQLMERAAQAFHSAFLRMGNYDSLYVFCGYGNNGGDGLAFARIMADYDFEVKVFVLFSEKYSNDFLTNRERLNKNRKVKIKEIKSVKDFPRTKATPNKTNEESRDHRIVIVDALFGSGLSRPIEGLGADLINFLNAQNAMRVALDVPSGLFCDAPGKGISFHADHTITFQTPKLSFLFPENAFAVGQWETVDIGLNQSFISSLPCSAFLVEEDDVKRILRRRSKFDHKGKFGHAFIHAGNIGKMGAAILCARACAASGAGLTTAHVPEDQSVTLNISIPEVMTEEYEKGTVARKANLNRYNAFAFGPGVGASNSSKKTLLALLEKISVPVVLDADALTILSEIKNPFRFIPKNSILTPHLKEFERFAGKTADWLERLERQRSLSKRHGLFIVLKGAYTCITTPDGKTYFNPTGNPGMAKGGSGDVLTGIIVSFLAQKYSSEEACLLGVYLHGLAGDLAVQKQSSYSLLASDIINHIGQAIGTFKV